MPRKNLFITAVLAVLVIILAACSPAPTPEPTTAPTLTNTLEPTPTLTPTEVIPTAIPATDTPIPATPTPWPTLTGLAPTVVGTLPGQPSGPYGVFGIPATGLLFVKNGPGSEYSDIGAFLPTKNDIMRTGPSKVVAGETWVELQMPEGGTGWVRAPYLTEYVTRTAFCLSEEIEAMLYSIGDIILVSDGWTLSTMVSPLHGLNVRFWRYGNTITYSPQMSKSIFFSLDIQNWGPDPSNGFDTVGTFSNVVHPDLLDVVNADLRYACGDATDAGPTPEPWPSEYANANFFTIHRPGPPGLDTNWTTWLFGFEYIGGKPYVFALIHFQWIP